MNNFNINVHKRKIKYFDLNLKLYIKNVFFYEQENNKLLLIDFLT